MTLTSSRVLSEAKLLLVHEACDVGAVAVACVDSLRWSPDGNTLQVLARLADGRLLGVTVQPGHALAYGTVCE